MHERDAGPSRRSTPAHPGATAAPATAFADAWEQTGSLEALREFADAAARMRPVVARQAGLSESELGALEHLVRGPLGPAELSRLLEVSTAAGTGIVDRLASHGHVTREPHEGDRRRTQVTVTASGREEVLLRLHADVHRAAAARRVLRRRRAGGRGALPARCARGVPRGHRAACRPGPVTPLVMIAP